MTENRVRVVAEYCPSCGGVHYPPAEKLGTGMLCTTCRYWQTHDHRVPDGELLAEIRSLAAFVGKQIDAPTVDQRTMLQHVHGRLCEIAALVVSDSPSPSEEPK